MSGLRSKHDYLQKNVIFSRVHDTIACLDSVNRNDGDGTGTLQWKTRLAVQV